VEENYSAQKVDEKVSAPSIFRRQAGFFRGCKGKKTNFTFLLIEQNENTASTAPQGPEQAPSTSTPAACAVSETQVSSQSPSVCVSVEVVVVEVCLGQPVGRSWWSGMSLAASASGCRGARVVVRAWRRRGCLPGWTVSLQGALWRGGGAPTGCVFVLFSPREKKVRR
jgi:hypothetical protein